MNTPSAKTASSATGLETVPETVTVNTHRVACDGASAIRGPVARQNAESPAFKPAALGHPKVYLEIDERGYVDCGYCDRRFILKDGPAEDTQLI